MFMKKTLSMTVKQQLVLVTLPLLVAGWGQAAAQSSGKDKAVADQAKNPISVIGSTVVVRTMEKDGKKQEVFKAAKTAQPGDLLELRQQVNNVSSKKLSGIRLKMPVDKATVFKSQKCNAEGVKALFSIDGGKTFASAPLKKTVTVTENGKKVTKEVTVDPSEYQYVQWTLPALDGKQSMRCYIRAIVK